MEDTRWRSVKRELPKTGEEVLAFYPKRGKSAALMCNQFIRPVDLTSPADPTHWRPRPKNPEYWSD